MNDFEVKCYAVRDIAVAVNTALDPFRDRVSADVAINGLLWVLATLLAHKDATEEDIARDVADVLRREIADQRAGKLNPTTH